MITPVFWKEHRIPTWVALFILLAGITAGVIAIQQPSLSFLRAAPEIAPDQIEITNITQSSFTVSWITSQPATGLVKYGENNQPQLIARDLRDPLTGNFGQYTTHWINISGLNSNSSYSFTIQSQGKFYDNNGSPYTITTAPAFKTPPQPQVELPRGTVITSDGQPAVGALVYLRAQNLSPQSVIVDPTGSWSINLTQARIRDLSQVFTFDTQTQNFELFIHGGDLPNSTVNFSAKSQYPLSPITLGQNYDFRSIAPQPAVVSVSRARFDFAPPLGAVQPTTPEEIVIWNPESDEVVATSYPLFLGSGPANITLTIVLESQGPITANVTTDDRGYWQWNPTSPLTQGEHTITISYVDFQNITHEIVRSFTVLAAEGGPAIEASPSANLSPTPTIRVSTGTPTPTTVYEIIPTSTRAPTASPTIRLTSTPIPSGVPTSIPTPTPAVPVSGTAVPTIVLTGIGLVLLGLGVILVL